MSENYNDTIELLTGVGYTSLELLKPDAFSVTINDGPKSLSFRQLISWLTDEIRVLANIEEKIHDDGEINDFMLELSGFLKEMICPFQSFTTGPISERLTTPETRVLLLEYLLSELMALRMVHKLKPKEDVVIEISETPAAAALKSLTVSLNMGKPPENISPKMLFDKINSRIDEILQKSTKNPIGKPLFTPAKQLTSDQWTQLEKYQQDLEVEYNLRRQMLITRLDVTIQSFQWSDRIKGKEDKIVARFADKRNKLDELLSVANKSTDLIALLAAREDLAIIEKTSSANVRKNTQASIQRHVIGKVPDRGGRAYEHAPPPPEMPSWQKDRNAGGGGQRGGSNASGGGGGGRSGGFNSQQQNRGGYQQQQQQQQQGFPAQHGNYKQSAGYGGNSNNYSSQGYQDGRSDGNYNSRQRSAGGGGRVQGSWSQGGGNYSDRPSSYNDRQSYNDNRSYGNGGSGGGGSGYYQRESFGGHNQRQKSNPFDQPFNTNDFYRGKGGRR